jgi:quercetin dioxygenase-like cupin family protein
MEILKQPPTAKLPAEWFTGDAWADVLYRGEGESRARLYAVRFAPGARTAWHSHSLGQTLYIVEGIALLQARGGEIVEAHPGDVVYTPPGEQHWHGATRDRFMVHIALWEGDGTVWAEHVSDAEYGGRRMSTRAVS